MYKIVGADQKVYGPVTADELRQWIIASRVNAQTRVEIDGQWKTLGDIPEFAELLAQRRVAPAPAAAPSGRSGMAVASLVLGILSVITCGLVAPITAPLGLIFGIMAISRNKKSGAGNGLALAGTIVSGVALALMIPMGAAMIIPAVARAHQAASTVECVNNEKELAFAIRNYSNSHGNQFPPATTWCDAIKPQISSDKVFQCPAGNQIQMSHYAFNSKLDGKDITRVAPDTVMLFETTGGWDRSGGQELLLSPPRHTQYSGRAWVNVAFVDGSVQRLTQSELSTLRWDP